MQDNTIYIVEDVINRLALQKNDVIISPYADGRIFVWDGTVINGEIYPFMPTTSHLFGVKTIIEVLPDLLNTYRYHYEDVYPTTYSILPDTNSSDDICYCGITPEDFLTIRIVRDAKAS
ncbi:MAG: hypothetical protein CMB80_08080 [Flammeovirgaceae bacterium]|nr:hypothetical protein [Flammeovirgaceae bacterium]|tara:strand:+ start:1851 stop:2207 length:357 start_codon:yes stop_codon:yes gene_type:complete